MEFKSLANRISLSSYGTLYGNLPGLVDNPLGYCEAYIYETPVLMLDMPTALPMYYYDITILKSGVQVLQIRYDNLINTLKFLDLSQILSANYTDKAIANLLQGQTSFNDFTMQVDVRDTSDVIVLTASTTLRACHSFNGTKYGWLPSELRMVKNLTIPLSFNCNGSFSLSYTGYSGGGVSLPFTAYYNFSNFDTLSVSNTTHSVTEKCIVRHLEPCDRMQVYWLSKEAGGWKSFAFDVVGCDAATDEVVPYVSMFTRYQGKRHITRRRLVAMSCDFRDFLYIRDIMTSDNVLSFHTDSFATTPTPVVLRVDGNISGFPIHRKSDIDFTIIMQEGEWL